MTRVFGASCQLCSVVMAHGSHRWVSLWLLGWLFGHLPSSLPRGHTPFPLPFPPNILGMAAFVSTALIWLIVLSLSNLRTRLLKNFLKNLNKNHSNPSPTLLIIVIAHCRETKSIKQVKHRSNWKQTVNILSLFLLVSLLCVFSLIYFIHDFVF